MALCEIFIKPRDGLARGCGKDAIARIARADGTHGLYACGAHRDSAITLVAARDTSPLRPLLYTPVGTHAVAVERARAQHKET